MTQKCPPGKYYCNNDKKCKPIPRGYHVTRSGYLEQDEDKKNGNGSNGNGNSGGNGGGNGNGNGSSNGGNGGNGGVSEAVSYKDFTKDAHAAKERLDKKKEDNRKRNNAAAWRDLKGKGIRFYDKKGKGRIKAGKKMYD